MILLPQGHGAKNCRKVGKTITTMEDKGKYNNRLLDSDASSHMTLETHNLSDVQEYSDNKFITIDNGLGLPISHIVTAIMKTDNGII